MAISESDKEILKSRNPAVTSIDLSNHGLNDDDVSELQELLQGNIYITSINLAHNNITSAGCKMLCLTPSLRAIDLSGCPIGDKGVSFLIGTKIESLDVSGCGITKDGADLLLVALNQFKKLEILKNPRIPEDLLYQIRKKFAHNLEEPHALRSLFQTVGIDLGLNINNPHETSPERAERHSEQLHVSETPEALSKKFFEPHAEEFHQLSPKGKENLLKLFSEKLGLKVDIIQDTKSDFNL